MGDDLEKVKDREGNRGGAGGVSRTAPGDVASLPKNNPFPGS